MTKYQIYDLCRSQVSVSSELAKDPTAKVESICEKLYGHHGTEIRPNEAGHNQVSEVDVERAFECGQWAGSKPSQLFLEIYRDVLNSLNHDPLGDVCSPSLIGSSGVCPITVIAPIPDICRHMSNLIARAEHEVFLATNYWMLSEGSKIITNGMKELSRRAVQSGRQVVIKVMYDRGDLKQIIDHHQMVPASVYADKTGKICLPAPEEIPNVTIEVVNYHKPALGTFHAKFMVVDRKIAIVQSNNIQDNDNLEMMAQYEGGIVDSLYDMAIITWHNVLSPPLPCLASPAISGPTPTAASQSFQAMFDQSGQTINQMPSFPETTPLHHGGDQIKEIAAESTAVDLPQHTSIDPHYDEDVASEVVRAIASLNHKGESRMQGISRLLNGPAPNNQAPGAPEVAPEDMMTPMIPIAPHPPFPIAMVNRPPYGAPKNTSLHVPQNIAWTSALRYAKSTVFIQTPDLNAKDLLPEIVSACTRGVQVSYYYCLGYNDAGELLPGQGGHNEGIANSLFKELQPQFHKNLNIYTYVAKDQIKPISNKFKKRSCHIKLMIVDGHIGIQGSGNQDTQSWYHSQEVNVMIDSELVCTKWIQGIKQNQNTHLYGLVQKEGEHAGCWVDPETGALAEGTIGVDAGKFAWAKGMVGAVNRVRGVGGF